MNAFSALPPDLPQPTDDGACRHLPGMTLPDVTLCATSGRMIHLPTQLSLRTVIYCYPLTGQPGKSLPHGWDAIPGARGCTPQACGFRDHYREIGGLGAELFGFSTQNTAYQQEAVQRLHLPFELLSDEQYRFCDALRLPTFFADNQRLVKRLTLIVRDHKIEKVFYPVFPPNQHAGEVMRWLKINPA